MVFSKPVNTKLADVFFEVANNTIVVMPKHKSDHITIWSISFYYSIYKLAEIYSHAALFHVPMILLPYRLEIVVNTMMAQKIR